MENRNFENIDILGDLDLSSVKLVSYESIETNNDNLFVNNLSDLEIDDNSSKIVENIDIKELSKKNKKNPFIVWIKFITKYILASSSIFAILLISTNYSAYVSIAKSYIYKWDLELKEQKLISSVEASNIREKYADEKTKKKLNEDISKLSINKIKKEQDKESINMNIDITPYENRIVIPKIWKNIPLLDIKNRNIDWEKELNSIFMKELEKGVVRYPGSSLPWEKWNSFIFWHSSNFPWLKWNYNQVFALLDKVTHNDEIIVYYWQKKFVYKIIEKKVVKPGDVSILERDKKKSEITIMTCWPIWTTLNRLIVVWELVE